MLSTTAQCCLLFANFAWQRHVVGLHRCSTTPHETLLAIATTPTHLTGSLVQHMAHAADWLLAVSACALVAVRRTTGRAHRRWPLPAPQQQLCWLSWVLQSQCCLAGSGSEQQCSSWGNRPWAHSSATCALQGVRVSGLWSVHADAFFGVGGVIQSWVAAVVPTAAPTLLGSLADWVTV